MPQPVRMSGAPVRFGLDGAYSAFPTSWALPDGQLVMAWRQGTDHVHARDGFIRTSWSSDGGLTWTDPATAVPYTGTDLRDPSISANADGSTLYLTYFKGSATLAAEGCFLRTSADGVTWSAETRLDTQPYAAICAPLVEHEGKLWATYYGRQPGDTRDSVYAAASDDGGATWSNLRVANGQADGRDYQEPWAVPTGSGLTFLFRWNNNEHIGRLQLRDGSWSPPSVAFRNGTGRPSAALTGSGALFTAYRRRGDGAVLYRASRDEGVTWLPPRRGQVITGPGWMTYSGPCTTPNGLVFCPIGIEESNGHVSRIWLTYAADGAAVTPLGDVFPDAVTRAVTDLDQVLAVDDFDRPDDAAIGTSLSGQPWVGTGRLSEGFARGSGGGALDFPVVNAGSADVVIDADLSWSATAGVGLLLRYRDANNHFLYTVEDSGNRVRFYVRNNGTYYNLAEAASVPVGPSTWRRFTAAVKGRRFLGFIDGQLVLAVNIGDVDTNLLGGQTKHGLKFNESGSTLHLCRRFVVRS